MALVNKIILNGLQIQPSNTYAAKLENVFNFNKTTNESDTFYDGTFFGNSKVNAKDLTLEIITKEMNDIEAIKHLNYLLQQSQFNLLFSFLDENIMYECIAECIAKAESDEKITCTLHLCDPNIYKHEESSLVLEKQITGGYYFDTNGYSFNDEGYSFTEKMTGNCGEVINSGYSTIYPRISIAGDGSDFKITNKTTGETLNINYTIHSGDSIEIICNPKKRKIKLNNSISLMKYKSGQFISLPNGTNEINVDYQGDCTVTINWRECYI